MSIKESHSMKISPKILTNAYGQAGGFVFHFRVQRAFQKYSILCLKFDNIAI